MGSGNKYQVINTSKRVKNIINKNYFYYAGYPPKEGSLIVLPWLGCEK